MLHIHKTRKATKRKVIKHKRRAVSKNIKSRSKRYSKRPTKTTQHYPIGQDVVFVKSDYYGISVGQMGIINSPYKTGYAVSVTKQWDEKSKALSTRLIYAEHSDLKPV